MSHEHYEFLAMDRLLTRVQRDEIQTLSSRAEVSATRCVVVYNYSSFRGNPLDTLAAHFDLFCYLSGWGRRRLAVRLPANALAIDELVAYGLTRPGSDSLRGGHLIVAFEHTDPDGEGWIRDDPDWADRIRGVRQELLRGDRRALYLGWLASLTDGYDEAEPPQDDAPTPPLPAGLGQLTESLSALAEFLRIDPFLLAAAAEHSATIELFQDGSSDEAALSGWLAEQSEEHKDIWLIQVVAGEHAAVLAEIHRARRPARSRPAIAAGPATVGALHAAAEELRQAEARRRTKAEAVAAHAARVAAAAVKEVRLRRLAARGDVVWRDVEGLIEQRTGDAYDEATVLLCDVRELARRDGSEARFFELMVGVTAIHRRKVTLVKRLRTAGLLPE